MSCDMLQHAIRGFGFLPFAAVPASREGLLLFINVISLLLGDVKVEEGILRTGRGDMCIHPGAELDSGHRQPQGSADEGELLVASRASSRAPVPTID